MPIVCKDKSGDSKRRCIVISERHCRAGMANGRETVLFTKSSTAIAGVKTPAQIRMGSTVVGLKFQGFLKQRNCLRGFLRHPGEERNKRS